MTVMIPTNVNDNDNDIMWLNMGIGREGAAAIAKAQIRQDKTRRDGTRSGQGKMKEMKKNSSFAK